MNTHNEKFNNFNYSRTTQKARDPFVNLERELKIRNFSPKTIKAYLYYNKQFIKFANKSSKEIKNEDIKKYLEYLADNDFSSSTINIAINALKFYYTQILKRKFFFDIKQAKKEKQLPVVLAKQEIDKMIAETKNLKHKFLIQFLYSTGMRVSEVVKIKMKDIDFDRKLILIKSGKGKKDRYTLLADSLIKILKEQLKVKNKNDYLFTSRDNNKHWHVMSVQKVVKQASLKAGINKNVSAHTLRHSFATHLLEKGTDIRYIQELLGHKNLETTQIYTQVANNILSKIKNPLD